MEMNYTLFPLCEYAVTVRFADYIDETVNDIVHETAVRLKRERKEGVNEIVPAFSSLTVYYDPLAIGYADVCRWLREKVESSGQTERPLARTVVIPVCYGGEFGPDLPEVARFHGISEDEVVTLHSAGRYRVYMIGFSPGFAYLGGLSPRLSTPRRAVPRTKVPAGSVGIAGGQTGVYPLATPGGWQLIGRTPLRVFDPHRKEPSLLSAGDIVEFRPIGADEFARWRDEHD
ncbi:5-oxoprolinase subunit PxpB [Geobacillus stearothermophilus]|nr:MULTISPECIES: 5-oxoprolinase subunit PxpB [Geobacillus]AKM18800.1 Kinase A inhibitor [Geobacillus sp. 12AMOR1]STO12004.1 Sporulation inhibitor kipI [[Flavobacterium] thermophilum]MCG6795414.1 5-oxoprolinase subunit PxpB [Geobacillus sp. YHL]MDF9296750.1 5-oxoprolinase subunit PxpB [Geobacillus stearothermophilus]QOR85588.1 5-oxoprolinase subunit PxpB [Geobacillus stearothermophilus]